ncbi:Alpha/Beta hydrolase protein [Mycena pura]|uniref:Carboxylic ester hydrolase n=1 Tax=Mycena pura TaxID=153505 RepID=A0AAD7E1F5_9AGAR|nr:Alpha/Beta hydrolase protein [Mycena pura]
MLALLLNLVLLLWPTASLVHAAPLSTVTLDYGTFTGVSNTSSGIIYFRGVPFADPPIGDLRWRAPVSPPSKHLGTVDATSVYIPIHATAADGMPVLVYFHGGGFELGDTHTAPPENIIQGSAKPVIFVTFEYRLGQFGFLVKEDGQLNAGLLDQRAALQWVQRYIGEFGGDPGQVTIWGQSAGAGSTMYHLIAEGGENKNLFHRVMGDSPPMIFMPDNTDAFTENLFTQFAELAGCGGSADVMACLRAAPTEVLASAGSSGLANRSSSLFPFGPIADGSFITERPVEAFRNKRFIHVPVMFGSNTNEGSHWSASLANPAANTSEPDATEMTVFNFLAGQWPGITHSTFETATAQFYQLRDFANFSLQGQQMYGEIRFICTALLISGSLHEAGVPAYEYHWDNPILGSDHASELQMFFNVGEVFDHEDELLAVAMRRYWTSFVTSGEPVAEHSAAWTATNGSPRLLLHPGQVGMEDVDNGLTERCAFWHGLTSQLAS